MLVGFIYSMFLVCEDGTPAYLQQALNTEGGALCRKEVPEKVTVSPGRLSRSSRSGTSSKRSGRKARS